MKIFITGGAGYIGTALMRKLISEGHQVTVYDNLATGQKNKIDPQAHFISGDVLSLEDLNAALSGDEYDTVVHLAALKSVGDGEDNPYVYYLNNYVGTLNVLEAMRINKIDSMVFSSTAAVYKTNQSGIYNEEDQLQPVSVYGKTKMMCEELIQEYQKRGYIKTYTIFRYFNLAGDAGLNFFDTNAQNVFPILAKAHFDNIDFKIFGNDYETIDGTGVRDYIHINDLVDAHLLAIDVQYSGICNLGTEQGTSVLELIQELEKQLDQKVYYKVVPRREGDVAIAVACAAVAQGALNWKPKNNIKDMVKSTIDVYGK